MLSLESNFKKYLMVATGAFPCNSHIFNVPGREWEAGEFADWKGGHEAFAFRATNLQMPKKSSEARMNFWRKAREGTGREMFRRRLGLGRLREQKSRARARKNVERNEAVGRGRVQSCSTRPAPSSRPAWAPRKKVTGKFWKGFRIPGSKCLVFFKKLSIN